MNPFSGLGEKTRTFFSDNRHLGLIVVLVALVFGGGYVTGRYGAPAKVVITERVREVEKQVVVEKIKTDVKIVRVEDSNTIKKLHRVISELTKPDGTKEKRTEEDLNVDAVVHTNTTDTRVQYVDRIVEKEVEKLIEKKTTITNQPNWMVQAGAGLAIPSFLGQDSPGVPGLRGAVIDAGLSRRVIGPFWVGLHGNTQGVVSLQLAGTF